MPSLVVHLPMNLDFLPGRQFLPTFACVAGFLLVVFVACDPTASNPVDEADLAGGTDEYNVSLPAKSADKAALAALYHSAGGTQWYASDNWLSNAPLDQWGGVAADDDGRVIGLYLSGNNLTGVLPSDLGNLSSLSHLYLDGNSLAGDIPHELGQLQDLIRLELRDNQLTGPIPTELGNLSNLETLNLNGNRLTGPIPQELGSLQNLETLSLDSNDLSGRIPPELGNLSRLAGLALGRNALTGPIPATLGNLTNLAALSLDDNDLRENLPRELGNLSNLNLLFLNRNYLEGELPPSFTGLTKLELLDFSDNYGLCAPTSLQDWLQELEGGYSGPSCPASRAQIRPPSPELMPADADALQWEREVLTAFFNATGGPEWTERNNWLTDAPLSDWFGVATDHNGNVAGLELVGNNLTGNLPAELGNLSSLTILALHDNVLNGPIPPELGKLSNLTVMVLDNNSLTKSIPAELGNLADLTILRLAGNSLTGPVPPELGNLSYLTDLDIKDNNLTGELPESLSTLPWLSLLEFNDNDGLCAPLSLQEWLQTVTVSWGPDCGQ